MSATQQAIEIYNSKNGNILWLYHRMVAMNAFLCKNADRNFNGKIISAINRYLIRTPLITQELTNKWFEDFYIKLAEEKALETVF